MRTSSPIFIHCVTVCEWRGPYPLVRVLSTSVHRVRASARTRCCECALPPCMESISVRSSDRAACGEPGFVCAHIPHRSWRSGPRPVFGHRVCCSVCTRASHRVARMAARCGGGPLGAAAAFTCDGFARLKSGVCSSLVAQDASACQRSDSVLVLWSNAGPQPLDGAGSGGLIIDDGGDVGAGRCADDHAGRRA